VNQPRLRIALLALVAFLAGAAAGVLGSRLTRAEADRGPLEDYAELLIREFDLSPERAGHLRVLLREYENEVARVVDRERVAYNAALEPVLRPIGTEYNRIVRDLVIPPHQRARFDDLEEGVLLKSTSR